MSNPTNADVLAAVRELGELFKSRPDELRSLVAKAFEAMKKELRQRDERIQAQISAVERELLKEIGALSARVGILEAHRKADREMDDKARAAK